tara:strand:+ start:230 stop:349 length:120 start_codon:yes stop_codon:yes gene_type:complete
MSFVRPPNGKKYRNSSKSVRGFQAKNEVLRGKIIDMFRF